MRRKIGSSKTLAGLREKQDPSQMVTFANPEDTFGFRECHRPGSQHYIVVLLAKRVVRIKKHLKEKRDQRTIIQKQSHLC